MSEALIRLDWNNQSAALTTEASQIKEQALEAVALIATVKTPEHHQEAIRGLQGLANVLSTVEKARKAAKAPLLDLGRRIDAAAEAFIADLKTEQARVAMLDGDFVKLEEAKARAAENLRLAEQRKLEEERRREEEAIRLKAEMERKRLDAEAREAVRLANAAKDAEAKARAAEIQRDIERQQKLSEAKTHAELDAVNDAHCRAVADLPTYAPSRAQGQITKHTWKIQITDAWALARAHPGCVDIKPRLTEIKAMLDAGQKVAGVTATKELEVAVRAGREPAAIDV